MKDLVVFFLTCRNFDVLKTFIMSEILSKEDFVLWLYRIQTWWYDIHKEKIFNSDCIFYPSLPCISNVKVFWVRDVLLSYVIKKQIFKTAFSE